MSLVAHRFGRVEFRIFVVVFYRQAHLKKSKQLFKIQNSKFDMSKLVLVQINKVHTKNISK